MIGQVVCYYVSLWHGLNYRRGKGFKPQLWSWPFSSSLVPHPGGWRQPSQFLLYINYV